MEKIYEVHWKGPFTIEQLGRFDDDPSQCLYAVYSTHPLYGRDALVYIGMTQQKLTERLKQHEWWTSLDADPITIHVASIGPFESWEKAASTDAYPPLPNEVIHAVESLLILAHQPAYNAQSTMSAASARDYRLFNSGRFGRLLPEVSGLYYEA